MAIDYGYEKGANGALFGNFYEADTAFMLQDPNSEGGFPVFGRLGEEGTGYTASASASDAVARVQKVNVTARSAAGSKKVSVTVGGKKVEITTTASDAAADVVGDLVAAINADTEGAGAIVTASGSASTLVLTFKTAGAAANEIPVVVASEDGGVTVALATEGNTEGKDAVTAGFFKGIAIRNSFGDIKHAGRETSVCVKGKIWVHVSGAVQAGQTAYYTAAGVISASSNDGTAFGKFVTNSTATDGIAVVELA